MSLFEDAMHIAVQLLLVQLLLTERLARALSVRTKTAGKTGYSTERPE